MSSFMLEWKLNVVLSMFYCSFFGGGHFVCSLALNQTENQGEQVEVEVQDFPLGLARIDHKQKCFSLLNLQIDTRDRVFRSMTIDCHSISVVVVCLCLMNQVDWPEPFERLFGLHRWLIGWLIEAIVCTGSSASMMVVARVFPVGRSVCTVNIVFNWFGLYWPVRSMMTTGTSMTTTTASVVVEQQQRRPR